MNLKCTTLTDLIKENRQALNRLMRNMISQLSDGRLIEELPCFCVVLENRSGDIIKVNKNMLEYLGYKEEEMINLSFMDFVVPENEDKTKEAHEKFLEGQKMPTFFLNHWRAKNGEAKPMYWLTADANRSGIDDYNFALAVKDLSI